MSRSPRELGGSGCIDQHVGRNQPSSGSLAPRQERQRRSRSPSSAAARAKGGSARSVQLDRLGRARLVAACPPDLVRALVLGQREGERGAEAEVDVVVLFER